MLGFGILSIIVVVLVGYITTSAFYFVSDSWIVPMAVSPTDEKVLALQAQLAEQENVRDRIADELNQAERYIAVQQTLPGRVRARRSRPTSPAARRRSAGCATLAKGYAGARDRVQRSNPAFAAASRKQDVARSTRPA